MVKDKESAVKVEGLTRRFGDFVAVDAIDLDVARGEIFGFLGPNGAGKSTTIKMLCGLLLPTSGSGRVGGFDIMEQPEEIKRSIGYMSQKFSLYEDLTVEENIDFFGGIYGVSRSRLGEKKDFALRMAGLEDRRRALTRSLPGGIRQRLALGCAILHEPPILFLDEPTSGVDPLSRRGFWDLIYHMAGSGTTIFVTTHYMEEADYCDQLALIYRGRIEAQGTPRDLRMERMKRDVLEVEADDIVGALAILDNGGIDAALFGSALHVTVENGAEGRERIIDLLRKGGATGIRAEEIVPSLEDVFVSLIEEAEKR